MFKNFNHNVIRLRKGKRKALPVYWIIAILNKKKSNSWGIEECLGYFQYSKEMILSIDFKRLGNLLNKGYILNKSVKKLIYLSSKY